MAEIDWEQLKDVRVMLWSCPNDGWPYPDRVWHRVEWDGKVATCLDCGESNQEDEHG